MTLDELPAIAERFVAHPQLILAGHSLAADSGDGVPTGELHMPPCHHPDPDRALAALALAGAQRRYGTPLPAAVCDRLVKELAVIRTKGFSSYILTVADLAAGRRTCGRGSGASSLVVYCLGITNVDPIRCNLLFERFLSPSRTDPPDLDVDFPWDERDAVFTYALQRYGADHVAMVATHQRLGRKGALRAVARAWGQGTAEIAAISRRIRGERRYGIAANLDPSWNGICADAAAVEGMHLHDGLHCGGLVITPEPIRDLVPIHRASKEIASSQAEGETDTVPAIAWEKDGAEAMGLVKIDILGNRSLAVIRDTLQDLAAQGRTIDEVTWHPETDPATGALISVGDTMGCFYIESPAMRQLLAKARCTDLDRLSIHSSIIRPAASSWITEYLRRLHEVRRTGVHQEAWYPHPALRGLLSDSFGILSYQEDVMLVAQHVAGFDERGANGLRKALGHWDTQERLLGFRDRFLAGCRERDVDPAVAEHIWGMIASFSGYSFAKAHSASYAMVSFQCAYLKVHAPAAFLARVVANEGGFYNPAVYLEDARRRGVEIRGPSVLASTWRTAPEGDQAIRIGFHLVPGVSQVLAQRIERDRQGRPYTGLGDWMHRVQVPERIAVTLAGCGALDDLRPDLNRRQIQWVVRGLALGSLHRGRQARQPELPGTQWLFPAPLWEDPEVPAIPAPDPEELDAEVQGILGICPRRHPLAGWPLAEGECSIAALAKVPHGHFVTIVAMPIARRQVQAQSKGRSTPMGFVTLEDATGTIETVWFSAVYRVSGHLLDAVVPLRVTGSIEIAFGVSTLHVAAAEVATREAVLAATGT